MRKIEWGCVCRKGYGHVGPVSDDSLSVSCDERQTLILQNDRWCGPWEPVDLLTFGDIPANILNTHSSSHGRLLFSELRMALFSFFRVGKANDLFCLDWFKDPWVLMINETVIWGNCCRLTVAYIQFTYGKHRGEKTPKQNPKANFGEWTG